MAKSLGISDYIKEKLSHITTDTAIPLRTLVKDLMEKFPSIKDETSASVRVNSVLKQAKVAAAYKRIKGKDSKTYIVLNSVATNSPTEDQVEKVDLQEENDGGLRRQELGQSAGEDQSVSSSEGSSGQADSEGRGEESSGDSSPAGSAGTEQAN